ncbi:MAG: hypothetical protein N3E48_03040 [Candidatus Bathyarchaeota archaeon]|nr:hypothetical protein [Candidatus Bathyarchaeota archaeon]
MAYAVCKNCGSVVEWFAGKGFRLKQFKCPNCKGELKAITIKEFVEAIRQGRKYYDLRTPYLEFRTLIFESF